MDDVVLTPEQEELAKQIKDVMQAGATVEIERIARLVASKNDGELFGETEFQMRDMLARLGTRALDAALEERKKGGTKDPASPAPSAASRPAS